MLPLVLIALIVTSPLAMHPYPYRTVRDAVLYLTPPSSPSGEGREGLTDDEIAAKVRLIVADEACVPVDRLDDRTRLAEDLGLD
jgi:hypothetical protein